MSNEKKYPTYENVPEGIDDIAWKSIFISSSEEKRLRSLMKKVKTVDCFEYDGSIYRGSKIRAAMDFVHSTNYPSDFHVWLIDNGYELIK